MKFVQTYSEHTHQKCSDMGIAPKLLAVNVIAGNWKMIVMSLLGSEFRPLNEVHGGKREKTRKYVFTAVNKLHEAGYVHGDLRGPNIMVAFGQESDKVQVKLVDFDWAGIQGDAHYPSFMNMDLKWPPNVKVGMCIEKEHDLFMVNQLYNDVPRADNRKRR